AVRVVADLGVRVAPDQVLHPALEIHGGLALGAREELLPLDLQLPDGPFQDLQVLLEAHAQDPAPTKIQNSGSHSSRARAARCPPPRTSVPGGRPTRWKSSRGARASPVSRAAWWTSWPWRRSSR